MHVNHQYLLDFCERQRKPGSQGSFTALDYGCGKGETVMAGRARGLEIFGAEAFYEGGDRRADAQASGLLGSAIREICNGRMDFPDNFFDVVVSNQVLEHVPDLEAVLDEIDRVLKPGGVTLHLFPSRDVMREGHCGIPFIHWFPKTARLRRPYMLALRRLGMGKFKANKPPEKFVDTFLPWLDKFTFYRQRVDILRSFRQHFPAELVEDDIICFRLAASGRGRLVPLARFPLFKPLAKEAFRKLAGLAVLAKKQERT
jgi:SAM-dependent methyltransferase